MNSIDASANELDTWDFDVDLAKYIVPRLKQLRAKMNHFPPEYSHLNVSDKVSMRQWLKDIDEMIYAWEIIANSYNRFDSDFAERIALGMKLFSDNILHLWE